MTNDRIPPLPPRVVSQFTASEPVAQSVAGESEENFVSTVDRAVERIESRPVTSKKTVASFKVGRTINPYHGEEVGVVTEAKVKRSFVVPILIVALVAVAAFGVERHISYMNIVGEHNVAVSKANKTIENLSARVNLLEKETVAKTDLLNAREGFVSAVELFQKTVGEVNGLFDVSVWELEAQEAVDRVYVNLDDLELLTTETGVVEQATSDVAVALQTFYGQQSVEEQNRVRGVGTVPREALDAIDPLLTLTVVEYACGAAEAMACVSSSNPDNVQISERFLNVGYKTWFDVMMHEVAHTVQFDNYDVFVNSENFVNLFGSDPELHADCMAAARVGSSYVSVYQNVCNAEQVSVAGKAWEGQF